VVVAMVEQNDNATQIEEQIEQIWPSATDGEDQPVQQRNPRLDAALEYADRGWRVFPCRPQAKEPDGRLAPHGVKDATTDPGIIREWWTASPLANIGIATGDGLLVLDVDDPAALNGRGVPATATVETSPGRLQYYFDANGLGEVRNAAGLLPSVDIRGDGGYVVAPPSCHPKGHEYRWLDFLSPAEAGLAAPPDWLRELLADGSPRSAGPLPDVIPEGQRNDMLTSLAGSMRRRGAIQVAIEAALLAENKARCEPPLPDEEVRAIAASVARYRPATTEAGKRQRTLTQRPAPADPTKLAELVPPSGFLREYSDWAQPTTSAPAHFHLFAGLVCVAAVLERRVRIEYGPTNIYPNLYLALVAPSSLYYKTSAQTPAKRLLARHQTLAKNGEQRSLILPREFSTEALFDILSEQPSGVFLWNEMGQQLKRFQRDYMAGTLEFFTEAYDSPEEPIERRLRHSHWTIEKPCFSIFAGTTIHWLEGNLTEDIALGGFLPRWLFVPASTPEEFMPLPPTLDDSVELKLSSDLAQLQKTYKAPQGSMAPKSVDLGLVKLRYERWACDLYGRISGHRAEELLAAWGVRLMPLALKLSMLFEMGTTGEPEISLDSWERGRSITDFLYVYLRQFVEEEMALTPFQKDRRKVLRLIKGAGAVGMPRAQISVRTKIKKRDLDEIMETLVDDEGTVVEGKGPKPERGPTAVVYYAPEYAP